MVDQLRDATGEESWISDMMFRDTVRALSARERRIIALRYLGGKTQTQVAREIGISQAQVSRLEKAALSRIKGADMQPIKSGIRRDAAWLKAGEQKISPPRSRTHPAHG